MTKDILLFAAKEVGLELTTYLLGIDAPIKRLIVGSAGDQEILDLARGRRIPAEVFTKKTQHQMAEEGIQYEWLLNLWCPHILRTDVLALANHRLNIHPSLVPYCRGNDNAAWTIRKGLPAGVSLIEMGEELDAGLVYAQNEVPYFFPARGSELHVRLQKEAVVLFKETWPAIYSGVVGLLPQTGPVSYHTRKQTEQDRVLDASVTLTLEDFLSWILAHDFYPSTTAEVRHRGLKYKLTLGVEENESD